MSLSVESWVGVIGSGQMGLGIALLCAQKGFHVHLIDPDPPVLERARARIQEILDHDVHKDRCTADEAHAIEARLNLGSGWDGLRSVQGVIEAVPEDETLKCHLFQTLSRYVPKTAWVATNTSSLSVTHLASSIDHPERFMGLHFFNPPTVMPLVEIIVTNQTSKACMECAYAFVQALGKTPIASKDAPGFIVNRVVLRMIREAVCAWEEGVASITAIDQALQCGANHPMGPLSLADFIGIDVCLNIIKIFHRAWSNQGYEPPLILEAMVQNHFLGRKSGLGFYDYNLTPYLSQEEVLRRLYLDTSRHVL